MAESVLIGAALGGGHAALSGNDMMKGMAVGGAVGGATAGFGGAGVDSAVSTTNPALVSAGSTMPASTVANGTMNPALTNSIGKSSNPFTQLGRDAYESVGKHVDGAFDTIGQGFDWMNDKTGMENKDWTMMGLNQGAQLMQRDPMQQIQAAPMGQGISRPNVDLSKSAGSLLVSNPLLKEELRQQGLL